MTAKNAGGSVIATSAAQYWPGQILQACRPNARPSPKPLQLTARAVASQGPTA